MNLQAAWANRPQLLAADQTVSWTEPSCIATQKHGPSRGEFMASEGPPRFAKMPLLVWPGSAGGSAAHGLGFGHHAFFSCGAAVGEDVGGRKKSGRGE